MSPIQWDYEVEFLSVLVGSNGHAHCCMPYLSDTDVEGVKHGEWHSIFAGKNPPSVEKEHRFSLKDSFTMNNKVTEQRK